MSGGNEVARNLLAQEPGRDNRHANAADKPSLAQKTNLQTRFLVRAHGLTEAQAHALAALIWGVGA